jgi:hypothetical protein
MAALGGELAVVFGRVMGSNLGRILGPEWGALASRGILGIGSMGGATGFALLCFVSKRSPISCLLIQTSRTILHPFRSRLIAP